MRLRGALIVTSLFLCTGLGCSQPPREKLLGQWTYESKDKAKEYIITGGMEYPKTITFAEGGNLLWDDTAGTYSWVKEGGDENTIFVKAFFVAFNMDIHFSSDKMIISGRNDTHFTYRRGK